MVYIAEMHICTPCMKRFNRNKRNKELQTNEHRDTTRLRGRERERKRKSASPNLKAGTKRDGNK